jgi:hypothetical protein
MTLCDSECTCFLVSLALTWTSRFSLHVPVFVGVDVEDVEEGVEPESVEVELEEPEPEQDPDAPPLTNAALGGPGNV